MSYEMKFEMYVGAKEQREEVLAVARKALITNGYEKFSNSLVASKDDCYMIEENSCMTFLGDNFHEAIRTIYEAIVSELPEVVFRGFSGYTWGTFEAGHCFEKKGNTLVVGKIGYEGSGYCPECDEEIVSVDNYNPEETYYCPECGEEIPNDELFSYFEKEDIIYEITDGKLIEK